MTWQRWLCVFTLSITLWMVSFPGALTAQQLVPAMEAPMYSWTNMARQQRGLSALTPNAQLMHAAQMHALNMAAQRTMSHQLDGQNLVDRIRRVGYPYAAAAENVAYNFGYPNPGWKLFEGWMNSPGHYQNIMNPQFTEIGVGVAYSPSGEFYACQVFGKQQTPMMSPNMYWYPQAANSWDALRYWYPQQGGLHGRHPSLPVNLPKWQN